MRRIAMMTVIITAMVLIVTLIWFYLDANNAAQKVSLEHKKPEALSALGQPQTCLAKNIWYEARGEGRAGWQLVADVTLNRVAHPSFPNSVCAVVYQPSQFSWTLYTQRQASGLRWSHIRAYAKWRLSQPHEDTHELHYHAKWLRKKPYWAAKKRVSRIVGQHVVYFD